MSVPAHIRIYFAVRGGHVHTRWFSGKRAETTHGKNGELVFTVEEWQAVKSLLVGYTGTGNVYGLEIIEEP